MLIAGGLNHIGKCTFEHCNPAQSAFGHLFIRRLDTSTDPPTWINTDPPLLMRRERWYPSVITLNDGDAFIAGYGNYAEPDGPGGCYPLYGDEAIHQTWD